MKRIISAAASAILLLALICSLASCGTGNVKCIDIKLTNEQYAFAVNKDDAALLEKVNLVVDRLTENDNLDKIVEKYFSGNEEEYKKVPAGAYDETKNQLVVATSIPFKPFEFSKYETGKGKLYRGIDIEIATYIAEELGAELVIREMDFKEVLNAVEAGDADIAMAGLTVNAERQEQVAFSHAYYEASQVIIARNNDNAFDGCRTKENVEEVLKAFDSSVTIGYQEDTTSGLYITGKQSPKSIALNVTAKSYDTTAHALQALINKEIDYVIADEGPAKIIVNDINK